jgi:uncharacterized SAM-binding protein YcdF (DUF218 family)
MSMEAPPESTSPTLGSLPRRAKIVLLGFLVLGGWLLGISQIILRESHRSLSPKPADAIVVLGAAAYGRSPSPVLRERLRHALALYRFGFAPVLLFTGGKRKASDLSEAEVAGLWVQEQGVPRKDILLETRSQSTVENLRNAKKLLDAHGWKRVILVSDPLHLARARLLGERIGLDVQTSPTPTTRFRSLSTKLPFLLRECYFYTTTLLGVGERPQRLSGK